jgi:hypothetical protein
MERASEIPRPEAPSARTNSTGEMSPTAPLTVSAMALCDLCADGLGEEPCASHRLVLWISVMSVESDHLNVGGDRLHALAGLGLSVVWCLASAVIVTFLARSEPALANAPTVLRRRHGLPAQDEVVKSP